MMVARVFTSFLLNLLTPARANHVILSGFCVTGACGIDKEGGLVHGPVHKHLCSVFTKCGPGSIII